jgi:ABC-2 type transport system permease protein
MQNFASIFPLKWLTQAMRYVFLPDGASAIEVSGSWQLGLCALVLIGWTIGGFVLAMLVFRWTPRGSS